MCRKLCKMAHFRVCWRSFKAQCTYLLFAGYFNPYTLVKTPPKWWRRTIIHHNLEHKNINGASSGGDPPCQLNRTVPTRFICSQYTCSKKASVFRDGCDFWWLADSVEDEVWVVLEEIVEGDAAHHGRPHYSHAVRTLEVSFHNLIVSPVTEIK